MFHTELQNAFEMIKSFKYCEMYVEYLRWSIEHCVKHIKI